eukprot:m.22877 g.22877  ORF g.22877 m.22877 type:complete len:209 (+) comp5489_c0_seq2:58-684(+)
MTEKGKIMFVSLNGHAHDDIAAYVEYRTIVGGSHEDKLIPECEYLRLREKAIKEGRVIPRGQQQQKKMAEEEEMAFYEKRYQARRKMERDDARQGKSTGRHPHAAVVANGIPLFLQDMYRQLEGDTPEFNFESPDPAMFQKRPTQSLDNTHQAFRKSSQTRPTKDQSRGSSRINKGSVSISSRTESRASTASTTKKKKKLLVQPEWRS